MQKKNRQDCKDKEQVHHVMNKYSKYMYVSSLSLLHEEVRGDFTTRGGSCPNTVEDSMNRVMAAGRNDFLERSLSLQS